MHPFTRRTLDLTVSGAVTGARTGLFYSALQTSHHPVGGEGEGWQWLWQSVILCGVRVL